MAAMVKPNFNGTESWWVLHGSHIAQQTNIKTPVTIASTKTAWKSIKIYQSRSTITFPIYISNPPVRLKCCCWEWWRRKTCRCRTLQLAWAASGPRSQWRHRSIVRWHTGETWAAICIRWWTTPASPQGSHELQICAPLSAREFSVIPYINVTLHQCTFFNTLSGKCVQIVHVYIKRYEIVSMQTYKLSFASV